MLKCKSEDRFPARWSNYVYSDTRIQYMAKRHQMGDVVNIFQRIFLAPNFGCVVLGVQEVFETASTAKRSHDRLAKGRRACNLATAALLVIIPTCNTYCIVTEEANVVLYQNGAVQKLSQKGPILLFRSQTYGASTHLYRPMALGQWCGRNQASRLHFPMTLFPDTQFSLD